MKVSLEPFPGAVLVDVTVLPIDAMLFCAHHLHCTHFSYLPNGRVPFAVFVEIGDMSPVEAAEYVLQNQNEIVAGARKLCATPVFLN